MPTKAPSLRPSQPPTPWHSQISACRPALQLVSPVSNACCSARLRRLVAFWGFWRASPGARADRADRRSMRGARAALLCLVALGRLGAAQDAPTQAQDAAIVEPVAPMYVLRGCDAQRGEIYCMRTLSCVLPDPKNPFFCVPEAVDFVGVGSFRWGASSSAYQIEGGASADGKGPSNWDVFAARPGRVHGGESGEVAADSYHKWRQDVALLRDLGVQDYRFSISWARVMPQGTGQVNAAGLRYYSDLVDALLNAGITPVVCLFHWDLPQALEEKGGWLEKDMIVRAFSDYAEVVFTALGDRVKTWITLNEPGTVVYMGYNMGLMAPGRCSDRTKCAEGDSFTEPLLAGHNMLVAHAHVVDIFRRKYRPQLGGRIGMVNCVKWAEPQNRADMKEWKLAQFLMEAEIGFFTDPLYFGDYPLSLRESVGGSSGPLPQFTDEEKFLLAGSQDFFGLNFYTSHYIYDPPNGGGIGPLGGSSWLYVTPGGLRNQLHWITERYGAPPIIITENGCDEPDVDSMADPAVPDMFRIQFMHEYIEQASIASLEGVNLQGYYVWSLLDNFEWADGYSKRFGIVHVDYDNDQKRTPKASYYWYRRLLNILRASGKGGPGMGFKEIGGSGAQEAASRGVPSAEQLGAQEDEDEAFWTRLGLTGGLVLVAAVLVMGIVVLRRREYARPVYMGGLLRRRDYDPLL
eukprot:scaffold8120_cov239-Pinguiococcus_pyrenoidosus.AAC.2